MALILWNKYKLIFLLYFVNLTLARHSNLGVHFVEPRQAYYYDDESSANMYQDDDVQCADLNKHLTILFLISFHKCVWAIAANNQMEMVSTEVKNGCYRGGATSGPPFEPIVLQTYETDPPGPCPILEVEIRIRTYYLGQDSPVNCSLLWGIIPDTDTLTGPPYLHDGRVVIYSECSEDPVDDPDSPHRIFTLIPSDTSIYGRQGYDICPYKNLTCDDISIAALEFLDFKQLKFFKEYEIGLTK